MLNVVLMKLCLYNFLFSAPACVNALPEHIQPARVCMQVVVGDNEQEFTRSIDKVVDIVENLAPDSEVLVFLVDQSNGQPINITKTEHLWKDELFKVKYSDFIPASAVSGNKMTYNLQQCFKPHPYQIVPRYPEISIVMTNSRINLSGNFVTEYKKSYLILMNQDKTDENDSEWLSVATDEKHVFSFVDTLLMDSVTKGMFILKQLTSRMY